MEEARVERRGSLRAVAILSVAVVVASGLMLVGVGTAMAGDGPPDGQASTQATNTGENVTGEVEVRTPGEPGGGPRYEPGAETRWPICWNDGLYHTTQSEQRNDIRQAETGGRPGEWGWLICQYEDGTQTREFTFFPAGPEAEPIDPEVLARSVTITPGVPEILTSPRRDAQHLVGLASWFWVDPAAWGPVSGRRCLGTVCVRVVATPSVLRVDPGDGGRIPDCASGGVAYRDDLAAGAQQSDCVWTYQRAAYYTATATIVYQVTWSSTIGGAAGPGGSLGTLTPDPTPFVIAVAEAQSLNTEG